jgi:hypothetical protein
MQDMMSPNQTGCSTTMQSARSVIHSVAVPATETKILNKKRPLTGPFHYPLTTIPPLVRTLLRSSSLDSTVW